MAQSVIWSKAALQDLASIAAFIARDSTYYAQKVIHDLIEKGDSLTNFPETGRMVPELNQKNMREKFIYSYRLIYQVSLEEIHIIAIIHGSRLLEVDSRFKPGLGDKRQ